MCLIVFALNSHSRFPLVVVANRDEYYQRPSAPLGWWQNRSILAGRDLRAGGTWMGVSDTGRWSALTNFREGVRHDAPRSRGELVVDFLASDLSPEQFQESIGPDLNEFGGFNLLTGTMSPSHPAIFCQSNRHPGIQAVGDGVHTLSNHLLDTPWPKAELARLKLGHALKRPNLRLEDMLPVLSDRQPFEDHELPVTGVGLDMERVLSPPFIVSPDYGTRCTSVLLVDIEGRIIFAEQSYLAGGESGGLALFEWALV